ncbi:MAG: AbiV family abortive infection protein [Candidatus Nitrosotenuis sp.]
MNRLMAACLENAEYLLDASRILFKAKFYGPASSLAALSIEECGKAFLFPLDMDTKNIHKIFRKQITSHKEKIKIASWDKFMTGLQRKGLFTKENPVQSIVGYQQKLQKYYEEGNLHLTELLLEDKIYKILPILKNLGIYVDFDEKGKLLLPRKTTRRAAALIIEQAEKRIKEFREDHRTIWTAKDGFVDKDYPKWISDA